MPVIRRHFAHLNRTLDGKPFLDDAYSLADIACVMAVFWSNRLAGPAPSAYPNLKRWYDSLLKRPAIAKAISELLAQDRALSAPVTGAHLPA
jgi:glutathione S-transferase